MKKITLVSAFLLLMITSCSKNDSKPQDEATPENCRISKIIEAKKLDGDTYGSEFNYTYDAGDNILAIALKVENDNHSFNTSNYTFVHESGMITESTNKYTKNGEGKIIKNSISESVFRTFEYTTDGYLKKSVYTENNNPVSNYEFKYSNGNLTQIIYTDTFSGGDTETYDIAYHTDKPIIHGFDMALDSWLVEELSRKLNGNGIFPFYINSFTGVFGKNSKNLVKSIKYSNSEDSSYDYVLAYSYTFDSKNKPVQIIVNDNSDGSIATMNLTYDCK